MAADRSTYPSSYPWTNWRIQLERDLATRINHISEQEDKALESLWEKCHFLVFSNDEKFAPYSKWTAQNNLAYFLLCFKILVMRLCE